MFSTYFAAVAAFFSLVSVIYSTFAYRNAMRCRMYCDSVLEWVQNENEASKVLKQLTEHEATLTDHQDLIASLNSTMKTLRSRIGMRELRARKTNSGSEIPDSKEDPEGWKRYMRAKLNIDKGAT